MRHKATEYNASKRIHYLIYTFKILARKQVSIKLLALYSYNTAKRNSSISMIIMKIQIGTHPHTSLPLYFLLPLCCQPSEKALPSIYFSEMALFPLFQTISPAYLGFCIYLILFYFLEIKFLLCCPYISFCI